MRVLLSEASHPEMYDLEDTGTFCLYKSLYPRLCRRFWSAILHRLSALLIFFTLLVFFLAESPPLYLLKRNIDKELTLYYFCSRSFLISHDWLDPVIRSVGSLTRWARLLMDTVGASISEGGFCIWRQIMFTARSKTDRGPGYLKIRSEVYLFKEHNSVEQGYDGVLYAICIKDGRSENFWVN